MKSVCGRARKLLIMACLLGLVMLLAGWGCEDFFGDIAAVQNEVKQSTGVDVAKPEEVVAAGLSGAITGNKEEKEAAETLNKALKLARHEQKAKDYSANGQYELARNEYKQALTYTSTSEAGQHKAAALEAGVAYQYAVELDKAWRARDRVTNEESRADLDRLMREKAKAAAAYYGRAAGRDPNPKDKAPYYYRQAYAFLVALDKQAGCNAASKSKAADADSSVRDEVDDILKGCK